MKKTGVVTEKQKVLMILYRFPPSNDAGAYRPIRFILDLNDFGWEPVVLTPSNGIFVSYDFESEKMFKDKCKIFRVPMLYPFGFLPRLKSRSAQNISDFIWKVWNKIAVPDGAICWLPTAVFSSLRIIKKEKVEVVFTTGGPFSALIIAAVLHWISAGRIKTVIDYRDPWTLNPFTARSGIRRMLEKLLEKFVLHHMNAVVFNTEEMQDLQLEGFKKHLDRNKSFTITNSFIELPTPTLSGLNGNHYTIVHAGNFYGNRGPEKFLEGLSIAVSKDSEFASCVKVYFYGLLDSSNLFKLAKKYKVAHLINFKPRVPQSEIIPILEKTNLLLLINSYGPGHHVFIPAKFFDYLRVRRPILCLAEKGALYNAVSITQTGKVVSPVDAEEIARGILDLYKKYGNLSDNFEANDTEINKFKNSYTTNQLAKVLNFACQG